MPVDTALAIRDDVGKVVPDGLLVT